MQLKGQDKIIGKVRCLEPTGGVFTPGQEYELYAYDDTYVRVRGDNKRIRWYYKYLFDLTGTDIATMESYKITDPIHDPQRDCIEATVTLKDGTRRWCFFVTPAWLAAYFANELEPKPIDHDGFVIYQITSLGDFAHTESGQRVGLIQASHLIIVSEITEETIERTLKYLDAKGELEEATMLIGPYEPPSDESDPDEERPDQ